MALLEKLNETATRLRLEEPALIGVSGGVDSVVLFDVLRRLGAARLVVAHVNHGLRGAASDGDEGFVRTLAASAQCACVATRADVAALAAAHGHSLETAGRLARQAFFQETARRLGIGRVFLAHHADDQVETLLMNLARGAGANGLGAMRESARWGALEVIRPMLGLWREEITAHAHAHGLAWREDATNAGREAFRNRVRHDVLPALAAALGREVKPALRRAAALAAEDESFLAGQAEQALRGARLLGQEKEALAVRALRGLPAPVLRRALRAWLLALGVRHVGCDLIEDALEVIFSSAKPASLNLPDNRRLRRREGRLFLDAQDGKEEG